MTTSVPLREGRDNSTAPMPLSLRRLAVFTAFWLAACGEEPRALPLPTPARSELVVLVAPGPLTYIEGEGDKPTGLEVDLIRAFAADLGVEARFIPVAAGEIPARLDQGQAHFAAAWYSPGLEAEAPAATAFASSRDLIVQHEASLPLAALADLAGRRLHVLAGTRQARTARRLSESVHGLEVVEYDAGGAFDLLEAVAGRRVDMALVDSATLSVALQIVPSIEATLEFPDEYPVAWQFGKRFNPELKARSAAFLERARQDGSLARIMDRYLGHVRRLKNGDVVRFLERRESVLPRLRRHFLAAQNTSGIDWRLLAALAYHESQWDPEAVSPTGVRGIMMLTEETADHLGVGNRLDPRESIEAGARYLATLRDQLPASIAEPDRSWMALAAYNLGPGHFNAGRTLARQLKVDPDSWYELKRILPLLAQPKYYERLKSGRARGGEAVILVENIRSYYDILVRHEPARFLVAETQESDRKRLSPAAR